jgi:S-adenosylmethionine:tRNA ribosyltransferase-isomerase
MDRLSDYDYDLPPDLIAQQPLADRADSRLLVLDKTSGSVRHLAFRDFPSLLNSGDVLVLNETRVTARRLHGRREDTGGAVELLVLRRNGDGSFACLCKPAKRLKLGVPLDFGNGLRAVVAGLGAEGFRNVEFNAPELLKNQGETPLPPYIRAALPDSERYQTVYASGAAEGSAAAPTAGLHFTAELLAEIEARGVRIAKVCLDVGIDTFRPVQVDDLADHVMHGENCTISSETAKMVAEATGRVVAVGTTTTRTLETFARRQQAFGTTTSNLFLRPGSEIKVVDAMLTNFHLPKTTMMMMLSAFASRGMVMAAYEEAVREKYRFPSFGDAMFIA